MKYESFVLFLNDNKIEYYQNYLSSRINTFEVGGEVKILIYPKNKFQLCLILNRLYNENLKYFLIGNGSNIYFTDHYNGVVVSTVKINKIAIYNNVLIAECGADISDCSFVALSSHLSGLEFAYGIPDTVGGGIYMNCSAYGGIISDVVKKSIVYDISNNKISLINNAEHFFENKRSVFLDKNKILLSTAFGLKKSSYDGILNNMKINLLKRINAQPLEYGSAGSAFKRPKNAYASKLIDECLLKGFSINDASVSEKHAGFIINKGNATYKDIEDLLKYLKKQIFDKYGIDLEEEIILVE